MLDVNRYAEDCLAGLNSVVTRQTVVIDTRRMSGEFFIAVIDHIRAHLPPIGLQLKSIRCSPREAESVVTRGSAQSGGWRDDVQVLLLEGAEHTVKLIVEPAPKNGPTAPLTTTASMDGC